jgi:hypothetical protein
VEKNKLKNNIHIIEPTSTPYPWTYKNFNHLMFRKHDHKLGVRLFLNCIKSWLKIHETCPHVMISYVEAVIKIWQNFVKVVTYHAYKPKHVQISFMISCEGQLGVKYRSWQTFTKPSQILFTASTYDIMTFGQVSWIFDQICFLYNLKTTGPQVCGHASWTWDVWNSCLFMDKVSN